MNIFLNDDHKIDWPLIGGIVLSIILCAIFLALLPAVTDLIKAAGLIFHP